MLDGLRGSQRAEVLTLRAPQQEIYFPDSSSSRSRSRAAASTRSRRA